jgi:selenide,water dikinase
VTGFGLAGHLASLLAGSGLAARIELSRLPSLPGALELLARGERSTFHGENARLRRALAIPKRLAAAPRLELLFDPQTAGGLLVALPAERADPFLAGLAAEGYGEAARIGELTAARTDGALFEVG